MNEPPASRPRRAAPDRRVTGAPSRDPRRSRTPLLLEWLGLAAVGSVLLQRLGDRLAERLGQPLNPDVWEFVEGARSSSFFYDTLIREPLHCFVLKLSLALPFDEERCIRLASYGESLLAAVVLYLVGRRLVGRIPALVVLLAWSTNPIVSYYGVSGLRAPLYTAVVVLFAGVLARARLDRPWRWGLALAGSGAALALTRLYSLGFFAGGLAVLALELRSWRRGRRRRALVLLTTAALGATLLVLPHLLLREPGQVSLDVMRMAAFEKRGSIEILPEDEPVGALEFIFEGRTVGEIVSRTASNYVLYGRKYLRYALGDAAPLAWLLPLGLAIACFSRRRLIAAAWVGSLVPVVFVLNLDLHAPGSGVENRLVAQTFPLSLLLMALAVSATLVKAVEFAFARAGRRPPEAWSDWADALLVREKAEPAPQPPSAGAEVAAAGDR